NWVRYCDYGIVVYRLSTGAFGTSTAGNQYAWNSIHSNTLDAEIGILYSTYSSTLTAYHNWWGSNPTFSVGPNANFYHDYPLGSDPWYGFAKVSGIASTADSDINQINTPSENKGTLLEGIELRLNKKYKEAMDFFISYIKEYPSDQQAYVELYNCRSKETTPELINFFNSLPKEASKDHKLLLSYLLLNEGNIEEAKKVNELIINENSNTSLSAKARINNIYISLYNENKIETAVSAFSSILNTKDFETTKEFEDMEYAIQSYARINNKTIPNFSISKNSDEQNAASTNIAEEFNLVGNYPNPFNPATTITYVLPSDGLVQIKIFDILGREIETLVSDFKSSGKHSISWDGSKFASGMYFCSVTFKNQTLYKKMLMVK
ncbi:MAG: T9SS type A sorting domain-containing protein, partial [Melioribacteraceae bacterium]